MNVTLFILFLCLSFCLFIFFYFKWYIKKRTSDPRLLADYRTEVDKLNAEIDSVTDRNLRLVEDRIGRLKTILDDADRRIAVYVRELDRDLAGAQTLYTSLGKGIRAALNTPVEYHETPSDAQEAQPFNVSEPEAKPPPAAAPAPPPPAPQPPAPQSLPGHQVKRQIRAQLEEMIDRGLPPTEIAARLDISLAEVDLAMNLRRG